MVVDRSPREEEAFRDLRVAHALRDEREHLLLAVRERSGVSGGRGSRTPGNGPGAELAQPSRHEARERPGLEALELRQRLAERGLVVALRQRQRCLVRPFARSPCGRGRSPVTRELERPRLRQPLRELVLDSVPAPPVGELT